MPSVLWRCWLGGRKGIWPVKNWVVGCWCGCVWVKVQICIWHSWCHCHSLSLAPVNPGTGSRVVPDAIQDGHKMVVCVCVVVGSYSMSCVWLWKWCVPSHSVRVSLQTCVTSRSVWSVAWHQHRTKSSMQFTDLSIMENYYLVYLCMWTLFSFTIVENFRCVVVYNVCGICAVTDVIGLVLSHCWCLLLFTILLVDVCGF